MVTEQALDMVSPTSPTNGTEESRLRTRGRKRRKKRARHSGAGGPVTIMVCSFGAEDAAIVRLYGKARVASLEDSPITSLLLERAADDIALPTRQIVEGDVERTNTGCGYGVPVMPFVRDRTRTDQGRKYKA
jgi:hypothetical protein